MMDLHELAKHINEVNRTNEWDDPTWESIPDRVMFAVTELSEAHDAVMGTGDNNLGEELADTAIRILSILNAVWGDDWIDRTGSISKIAPDNVFEPIEVALWPILSVLSGAVESWRYDRGGDTRTYLELAFKQVFILATLLRISLSNEMLAKIDKNARRGKWHGKATSAG